MKDSDYCIVDDCTSFRAGNSTPYCGRHRARVRKYGDPSITLRTPYDATGNNRRHKPTQITFWGMRDRCFNKNARSYPNYGGRGIKICDRWLGVDGYINFLEDMGERPDGCTIDRIDNNGNYEPFNCRWATASEQQLNTKRAISAHLRDA